MATSTQNVPGAAGPVTVINSPGEAGLTTDLINEPKERFFTLKYRQGSMVREKNFTIRGNLKDAMDRGRAHCKQMGIVFILVNPLIVDLDYQEKIRAEKGCYNEQEDGLME